MLFNGKEDGITIGAICESLKIDEETARKNLANLRHSKIPVLLCRKNQEEQKKEEPSQDSMM